MHHKVRCSQCDCTKKMHTRCFRVFWQLRIQIGCAYCTRSVWIASNLWVTTTDIHQRYQNSYTAPCNGIISHGARFGSLRVFADHTRKTNALTIFADRAASMRDCLHAQTAVHAGNLCTWWTMISLITGKPEDPQIKPHARIKLAQGLVSLCVSHCNIIRKSMNVTTSWQHSTITQNLTGMCMQLRKKKKLTVSSHTVTRTTGQDRIHIQKQSSAKMLVKKNEVKR